MPHTSQHLARLDQEITDLQNMNTLCAKRGGNSALDQVAIELRADRLREIQQELLKMLNCP
jgi:hypothetical protein